MRSVVDRNVVMRRMTVLEDISQINTDAKADSWHDIPTRAADLRWRIQGRYGNGSAAHMLLKQQNFLTSNLYILSFKNKLQLHTIQIKYQSKYSFDTKLCNPMKLKNRYAAVLKASVPLRLALNKMYATYMVILGNKSSVHITRSSVRLPSSDCTVRTPTDICITREYNTKPPRAPLTFH